MSANTEIERKFLVDPEFVGQLTGAPGRRIEQFYLGEGFDPAPMCTELINRCAEASSRLSVASSSAVLA